VIVETLRVSTITGSRLSERVVLMQAEGSPDHIRQNCTAERGPGIRKPTAAAAAFGHTPQRKALLSGRPGAQFVETDVTSRSGERHPSRRIQLQATYHALQKRPSHFFPTILPSGKSDSVAAARARGRCPPCAGAGGSRRRAPAQRLGAGALRGPYET